MNPYVWSISHLLSGPLHGHPLYAALALESHMRPLLSPAHPCSCPPWLPQAPSSHSPLPHSQDSSPMWTLSLPWWGSDTYFMLGCHIAVSHSNPGYENPPFTNANTLCTWTLPTWAMPHTHSPYPALALTSHTGLCHLPPNKDPIVTHSASWAGFMPPMLSPPLPPPYPYTHTPVLFIE